MLYARQVFNLRRQFLHHMDGPVAGSAFRQLIRNHKHTLIFIGHITGRGNLRHHADHNADDHQTDKHQPGMPDADTHLVGITTQGLIKPDVEIINQPVDRILGLAAVASRNRFLRL